MKEEGGGGRRGGGGHKQTAKPADVTHFPERSDTHTVAQTVTRDAMSQDILSHSRAGSITPPRVHTSR